MSCPDWAIYSDKIKELLKSGILDSLTVMVALCFNHCCSLTVCVQVLVNAIYFKGQISLVLAFVNLIVLLAGKWEKQFDKAKTKPQDFSLLDASKLKVIMMQARDWTQRGLLPLASHAF